MGDTHNELTGDVHGVVYQARTMNFFAGRAAPALSGLPRPEPAFTGRAAELARLAESLRPGTDDQAVVVAGLGGVGKTTLAIRAAHDAVAAGWFPGGVLHLTLHGYSPDGRVEPADALATLLRDLGVEGQIPPNLAGRESLYRSELARRDAVLIVLDNASSSDQVRPLLPGSPQHRVLVTSRNSLADLVAALLDLDVLDRADTVELVRNSLRDRRVADEPEAAAALGELCGHLPLALSIVTSMLADDPEMPISELVDALRGKTTRLKELSYGKNLAVRAAFELSFNRLSEAQQRMFELLAVHPGDQVSVRCAAALADMTEREARRTLDDLRRAHMILSGKPRGWFRFHDLVRLYAVELAKQLTGRDDAVRRLLQHYFDTALATYSWMFADEPRPEFTSFRDALAWFEAELPSFRAVVEMARDTGNGDMARNITLALSTTWIMHGPTEDVVRTHRVALEAIDHLGDAFTKPILLRNFGRALIEMGELDAADDALTQACELGTPETQSAYDSYLAQLRNIQGRHQEAIALLEGALSAGSHTVGIVPGILGSLGEANAALGNHRVALDFRLRAVDQYDRPRNAVDYTRYLSRLADAHVAVNDVSRAIVVLEQALEVLEELGYLKGQLDVLHQLATHHGTLQQYEAKHRYLRRRTALFTEGDQSAEHADAVLALGISLAKDCRHDEAVEQLSRAAELHAHLGLVGGEARSHDWLRMAEQDAGNPAEAATAGRRALELYRRNGEDTNAAYAAKGLGNVVTDQRLLEEALAHFRAEGMRAAEAETLDDIGRLFVTDDYATAARYLGEAAEILREVGDKKALADTLITLSNTHSNNNDPVAAEAVAREILAIAESPETESWGWLRLGRALVKGQDHAAAVHALDRVVPDVVGPRAATAVRYHLGIAHRELGDLRTAREHLTAALDQDRGVGDRYGEGMTLHQLGLLHRAEGDVEEGHRLGEQAVALLTEAGETKAAQRVRAELDELS